MSCAKSDQNDEQSSSSTSSSAQVKKNSSNSSKRSKNKASQETKRVGSPEFGYIDIPSKWIKFFDAKVEGLIQYTDGSAYNIVTMNAVSKAEAEVADGETFNAETIAQHVAYNWSQKDNIEKMWGSKSTVSGIEAFQINIILKSGQLANTLVFQKDDKVYILSFEGDEETLDDFITNMKDTWSLDGKGAVSE
jgi:putative lipoprotein